MNKILGIRRDDSFSPNSAAADRNILLSVLNRLGVGAEAMIDECDLTSQHDADVFLSMGRLPQTLELLREKERQGRRVVNSSVGVERCARSVLEQIMRKEGIAVAPSSGEHGYWVKRGDAAAQSRDDVVFCADEAERQACIERFAQRGITNVVVSAHVVGDLVKFYGVGDSFFRFYYPTDDGQSKFGDERRNGTAHHYNFDTEALRQSAVRLAASMPLVVYGGDCIVDADGRFYFIDFNDWPSFSRCREEAAEAIAEKVKG